MSLSFFPPSKPVSSARMSTLSRGTETSQMDPASADIEAGPSRGSATDIELSKMSPPPLDIVTSAATPAETPAETPTETNRYIQQRHDLSKQAAPLYQQWTLPENRKCIRLLTIKAPDPSHPDGGPLEASMSVEDVDNGTSFAALSYVWGAWSSKNPPHTILCEEYPIPITPNCFSALRHLRHQLDKFTVWVDAICIDQENEKEKLHQIPLMRDIYSRAKVSYMWLGKGNDKTDRAMSWLARPPFVSGLYVDGGIGGQLRTKPRLWAAFWMCCTAVFRPSKDPYVYFSPDLLQRIGLSSGESKFHGLQAECFEDLINRDWTRRIWTYQEVLLSRNPIVICGKAQVHWSRVVLSMLWLNYLGNGVLPTGTQSWIQVAIARKGLMRKMSSSSYDHSSHGGPSMGASQPPLNSAVARSEEIDPMDNVSCSVYLAFLVRVHRFSVYFAILSFAAFAAVASILFAFSFLSPVPINGRRFHTSELALALCACLVLTGLMAIAVGVQRVKVWRPIYRKPSKQMRSANNIDGFLEAVITRKCSRPEDKAFGLQAVVSIKAGRQLPPPDMTTSLGNIYQQFTKSLYYATEDLRFLSMAAITEICGEVGIYGQPSWVPDWSLAPDVGVEWLDPFRVAPARPGGIFLGTHSEPMNMHQLLTTKSFCEFQDGSLPKIVIRGYHYCTVADTFKFESTSEKYDETEHDKHLRNIRSIHTLIQARSSSIIFIKSISATPFDILEISSYLSFISVSSVAPSSAVMHILCLSRKINRSSFRSLAVLLARFMCALPTFLLSMSYSNFLRLKKRHTLFSGALLMASMLDDLLGVHITICSRFAEENKNVFAGILPQDENAQQQKVVGLCSPDVEAGDVVIITSGPPQQPL